MDIGAILVGCALLLGAAAYVARPLFEKPADGSHRHAPGDSPQGQLIRRRDAIYALIRELDVDFQTGKVNDQDYQVLRERYVAEGVSTLRQLDAFSSENKQAALAAEIEAQVLALRRTEPVAQAELSEGATVRFCTRCGHPANPADRFCGRCGTALRGVMSQ